MTKGPRARTFVVAERVGLSHSLRSRDLSVPLSRDSESTCGSNPFPQYKQGLAPHRWGWPLLMAERVGFEPTVGCPTLDFESSALNQTQPSLLFTPRRLRFGLNEENPMPFGVAFNHRFFTAKFERLTRRRPPPHHDRRI